MSKEMLFLLIVLFSLSLMFNSAFAENREYDIDYDKDTGKVIASWNLHDNDDKNKECRAVGFMKFNESFKFGDYSIRFFGDKVMKWIHYVNTKFTIGESSIIPCTGSMTFSKHDFPFKSDKSFVFSVSILMLDVEGFPDKKDSPTFDKKIGVLVVHREAASSNGKAICWEGDMEDVLIRIYENINKSEKWYRYGDGKCTVIHYYYPDNSNSDNSNSVNPQLQNKKSSGCIDCIPPTLGLNIHGKNMVDDGFSFNGNYTNVQYLHTPFPLISTQTGVNNTMTMKIFENHGINDLTNVRVGLGMKSIGTPIDLAEAIINIKIINGIVSDIEIKDSQFLIQDDGVTAISDVVKCKESSNDKKCLEVKLIYSYRESPMYNIVAVSPVDFNTNSWPFYFNDGIKVDGMSLNEPATIIAGGDLYTQLNKWQDIWIDDNGIEYEQNIAGHMVRTTAWSEIQCNDTPLDEITGGVGRANCHFRALTTLW